MSSRSNASQIRADDFCSIPRGRLHRLLHNHPSGDPTPSKADIEMTREIVKAAALFNVAVHDHVIIARGKHSSLKSLGLF